MSRDTRTRVLWLAAAVTPLWFIPLAWLLAFSRSETVGAVGGVMLGVELFSVLPLLACLLFLVSGPLALLVVRNRRPIILALVPSALFVGSWFGGVRFQFVICRAELARVAASGQPLIDAINAYQAEHGRPPATLDELVPKYIDRIPTTDIGAWPQFYYWSGQPEHHYGNEWVLVVNPPSLPMGFDSFNYFPRQNYSDAGFGPIANWGYFHD